MEIPAMVKDWLVAHGYSGLVHEDHECGCYLDDLMPCEEPGIHCQAGYTVACTCEDHDGRHVQAEKPEAAPDA